MNIDSFEKKYDQKGGVNKLKEMMSELRTVKEISEYFGVSSREQARQWIKGITGSPYDPRYARKRKRIEELKEIISKIGSKEDVYKLIQNGGYVEEALKEYQPK